jgi:hypothetical protein
MLAMSATPIPRTLALVTYGNMLLSSITELPPGRQPVQTRVLVEAPEQRQALYQELQAEVADGGWPGPAGACGVGGGVGWSGRCCCVEVLLAAAAVFANMPACDDQQVDGQLCPWRGA